MDMKKIIRVGVVSLIFLAVVSLHGITDMRQANQMIFMLGMISMFSLVLRNIWATLFLCWTVFLYSFFKFETGSIYLSNIFFGSILYFVTKSSFKRQNIDLFVNAFLWFVFVNVAFMVVQSVGFDFVHKEIISRVIVEHVENTRMNGFMGHASILGTLIALAIPMLASRGSKWAMVGAIGLFFPLYLCKTSLCFIAGLVGLLFILFFRIPRKIWILVLISSIVCGTFYVKKVDGFGVERFGMWKRILNDSTIHPVTGWGLDSFANVTPQKNFRYYASVEKYDTHVTTKGKKYNDITKISWWDNTHNLYISLAYEFGYVGLFLFIAYIRQGVVRFKKSIKNVNTIALAGFLLVFLIISMGHFPIFLARMACFIIPAFALFEVSTS